MFWVLWLPLCAFLTKRAGLWRRRFPLTLAGVALFGCCGWIAEQFAPPYSGALLDDWHVFGTDFPLAFQASIATTTFAPPALLPGTTYYRRVDEVAADGTTPGFT